MLKPNRISVSLLLTLSSLLLQPLSAASQAGEFVAIPAGSFIMGTADLDEARIEIPTDSKLLIRDEQPAHKVAISAFEIGKFEVTQEEWLARMGSKPGPDKYWQHPQWQQLPVVSVSWDMAQAYIQKLNDIDKHYRYRLPTEAEYEYVARAGSTGLRPFDAEDMNEHAWTITNSGDVSHPVGKLKANAFGVYDIYGNAWEWVNDWYQPDAYAGHTPRNPTGPATATQKVRRGGSYHCATHFVRPAYRAADVPSQRYSVLGFRLVRERL